MPSAHAQTAPLLAAPRRRTDVVGETARYLGAVSILVVGAIHAQQYYDAYFSVVPTIGTLFLLSFIGAATVGVVLFTAGQTARPAHRRPHPHTCRARRDRDRARDARQPARQRVHPALRLHGVRLPARDRPNPRLRRRLDSVSRLVRLDGRAATRRVDPGPAEHEVRYRQLVRAAARRPAREWALAVRSRASRGADGATSRG